MAKNYYDWLEVSPIASSEVIEKAYKALVKKYHPDLQETDKKDEYENKLKCINEAYEILSDTEKRKSYDVWLQNKEIKNKQADTSEPKKHTNSTTSNPVPLKNLKEIQNQLEWEKQRKLQEERFQKELQMAKQKAYYDAYIQDLKNRGYKIKYKRRGKDYIKLLVFLLIIVTILYFIFQLPYVQHYLSNLIHDNLFLKNLFWQ